MTIRSIPYWLHAITPLHVGAGRGIGHIDLPVIRERVTTWPYVPGSAVKGVLRAHHAGAATTASDKTALNAAFGTGGDSDANAGALAFGDARLVCMPARSAYGTFAWCTSPLALARLARDLGQNPAPVAIPEAGQVAPPNALVTPTSALGPRICLDDLEFAPINDALAKTWAALIGEAVHDSAWLPEFMKRFVILPDEFFTFLAKTGTEVAAHVAIDQDKGTVKEGPWYEEALPAEAVLAGLVHEDIARSNGNGGLTAKFCGPQTHQFGGKATTGRGMVRFNPRAQAPASGGGRR